MPWVLEKICKEPSSSEMPWAESFFVWPGAKLGWWCSRYQAFFWSSTVRPPKDDERAFGWQSRFFKKTKWYLFICCGKQWDLDFQVQRGWLPRAVLSSRMHLMLHVLVKFSEYFWISSLLLEIPVRMCCRYVSGDWHFTISNMHVEILTIVN